MRPAEEWVGLGVETPGPTARLQGAGDLARGLWVAPPRTSSGAPPCWGAWHVHTIGDTVNWRLCPSGPATGERPVFRALGPLPLRAPRWPRCPAWAVWSCDHASVRLQAQSWRSGALGGRQRQGVAAAFSHGYHAGRDGNLGRTTQSRKEKGLQGQEKSGKTALCIRTHCMLGDVHTWYRNVCLFCIKIQ